MHLPCQPPVSSTSINTNTYTAWRNSTPGSHELYTDQGPPEAVCSAGASWTSRPGFKSRPLRWGVGVSVHSTKRHFEPARCEQTQGCSTPLPRSVGWLALRQVKFGENMGYGGWHGLPPLPSPPSQSHLPFLLCMLEFFEVLFQERAMCPKKGHENHSWRVSQTVAAQEDGASGLCLRFAAIRQGWCPSQHFHIRTLTSSQRLARQTFVLELQWRLRLRR